MDGVCFCWRCTTRREWMTSAAKSSDNYSATRRPDSTIIAPVSVYHHVSCAETYSRYRDTTQICNMILIGTRWRGRQHGLPSCLLLLGLSRIRLCLPHVLPEHLPQH